MGERNVRETLLRAGMGCFAAAALATAANVLLLPYARACHGYGAAAFVASALGALLAMLALTRLLSACREEAVARFLRVAVPAFLLFMFAAQAALAHLMAYTPAGDNAMLIGAARMIANTGSLSGNADYRLYLSRYSNQWGFVLMLSALFKLFSLLGLGGALYPLALLQAALYAAGLHAALGIARDISGARGEAALLAALACCPPLYLAAAVLYTDTFSLPFLLLTLRAALRVPDAATPRARLGWALLAGALAAVGAQIKPTVLIALLAAMIVWALAMRPRAAIASIAAAALLVAGASLSSRGAMLGGLLERDVYAQEHTPAIHWVMMSIPTGDNPYGGLNNGDYAITWGMMDDGASHEEVMASIAQRMKDRIYTLRYPNRLLAAMLRKNAAAMGDGTFGMTEMLDDDPVYENAISSLVLAGRPLYTRYAACCSGIFWAQLLAAALGAVQDIRRRDARAAALCVTAFGGMLFLLLWEARSRYLFAFLPVVLLLSARAQAGLAARAAGRRA